MVIGGVYKFVKSGGTYLTFVDNWGVEEDVSADVKVVVRGTNKCYNYVECLYKLEGEYKCLTANPLTIEGSCKFVPNTIDSTLYTVCKHLFAQFTNVHIMQLYNFFRLQLDEENFDCANVDEVREAIFDIIRLGFGENDNYLYPWALWHIIYPDGPYAELICGYCEADFEFPFKFNLKLVLNGEELEIYFVKSDDDKAYTISQIYDMFEKGSQYESAFSGGLSSLFDAAEGRRG